MLSHQITENRTASVVVDLPIISPSIRYETIQCVVKECIVHIMYYMQNTNTISQSLCQVKPAMEYDGIFLRKGSVAGSEKLGLPHN